MIVSFLFVYRIYFFDCSDTAPMFLPLPVSLALRFTSLSDLTSLELIDIHGSALLEFLDCVGPRLTSLRLVETSRSPGSVFSDGARPLFSALRLCPALSSLRLALAADAAPPDGLAPRQVALPALARLELDGARAAELTQLLCSAAGRLEELQLEGLAGGLTDEAVRAALDSGGLHQLRSVAGGQGVMTGRVCHLMREVIEI